MSLDHPVHPATVHWPIAFLSTAYGLDALHVVRPYLPSTLTNYLPAVVETTRIGYWALGLGVLTALPSAASGIAQAAKMVQNQGLYDQSGNLKAKSKVLIAHALVNDIVIAVSAWIWYKRRNASSLEYIKEGLNPVAYEPQNWMVGASIVLGALLMLGANLGGTLVYDYGLGLSMGKKVIKKNE